MREIEKQKIRVLRCETEGCKMKTEKGEWPKDWHQTGESRFGKRYDPDGIASWCPKHPRGN